MMILSRIFCVVAIAVLAFVIFSKPREITVTQPQIEPQVKPHVERQVQSQVKPPTRKPQKPQPEAIIEPEPNQPNQPTFRALEKPPQAPRRETQTRTNG